jgi:hypothetical protein
MKHQHAPHPMDPRSLVNRDATHTNGTCAQGHDEWAWTMRDERPPFMHDRRRAQAILGSAKWQSSPSKCWPMGPSMNLGQRDLSFSR